jgi:hypothetical protein
VGFFRGLDKGIARVADGRHLVAVRILISSSTMRILRGCGESGSGM